MKRIIFLAFAILPILSFGQIITNKPAGSLATLTNVSAIISDSISALKSCAIFYSNDGGADLSNDSTDVYVDRCGEVSLFLNLTTPASSNLIANFNNPGDEDLGKTVTITALNKDITWRIQIDGLFPQGENIISNYTMRDGEVVILTAQETDLGNRWVFTSWGVGIKVFTGVVGDTATYTDADEGSVLLIGSAPIDSIFYKGADAWTLAVGGIDLATVQGVVSDSSYFYNTLSDFTAVASSTDFPINRRIRIGDTGAEYVISGAKNIGENLFNNSGDYAVNGGEIGFSDELYNSDYSPSGLLDAEKFTCTGNDNIRNSSSIPVSKLKIGSSYIVSWYIKNVDMSAFRMIFQEEGPAGTYNTFIDSTYTSSVSTGKYTRIWAKIPNTIVDASTVRIVANYVRAVGSTGQSFYLGQVQLEESSGNSPSPLTVTSGTISSGASVGYAPDTLVNIPVANGKYAVLSSNDVRYEYFVRSNLTPRQSLNRALSYAKYAKKKKVLYGSVIELDSTVTIPSGIVLEAELSAGNTEKTPIILARMTNPADYAIKLDETNNLETSRSGLRNVFIHVADTCAGAVFIKIPRNTIIENLTIWGGPNDSTYYAQTGITIDGSVYFEMSNIYISRCGKGLNFINESGGPSTSTTSAIKKVTLVNNKNAATFNRAAINSILLRDLTTEGNDTIPFIIETQNSVIIDNIYVERFLSDLTNAYPLFEVGKVVDPGSSQLRASLKITGSSRILGQIGYVLAPAFDLGYVDYFELSNALVAGFKRIFTKTSNTRIVNLFGINEQVDSTMREIPSAELTNVNAIGIIEITDATRGPYSVLGGEVLGRINNDGFVHDPVVDSTYIQGQLRVVNLGENNPDSLVTLSSDGKVSGTSWSQARDSIVLEYPTLADFTAIATSRPFEVNDRIKITGTGAEYLVGSSAVSGYTTDTVAVIPVSGGKYAVLQPQNGRIFAAYFGAITLATLQKAVNFSQVTSGNLYIDQDCSLSFTNGQAISITKNLIIEGRPDKTLIDVSQEPASGVTYNVFSIANNIKVMFQNLHIKGHRTGYVTISSSYTLSGNTVTAGSAVFTSTDDERYLYLDSSGVIVRRRISSYTNTTTVVISDGTSLSAAGTFYFYRSNSNLGISLTGSIAPATINITYKEGQKWVRTASALDSTYIGGYIYLTPTKNNTALERKIQSVSGDTLYFGFALPDTIGSATVSGRVGRWHELKIDNVKFSGNLGDAIYRNNNGGGGDGLIEVTNSEITSLTSALSVFGDSTARNIHLKVDNVHFYESGTDSYGDANEHPADANGIMMYIHPHVNGIVTNSTFTTNRREGLKWFSAGGIQSTVPQKYLKLSNLSFYDMSPVSGNYGAVLLYQNGLAELSNINTGGKYVAIQGDANVINMECGPLFVGGRKTNSLKYFTNVKVSNIEDADASDSNKTVYFSNSLIKYTSTGVLNPTTIRYGNWNFNNVDYTATFSASGGVGITLYGGNVKIKNSKITTTTTTGNVYALSVQSSGRLDTVTLTCENVEFNSNGFAASYAANSLYPVSMYFLECRNTAGAGVRTIASAGVTNQKLYITRKPYTRYSVGSLPSSLDFYDRVTLTSTQTITTISSPYTQIDSLYMEDELEIEAGPTATLTFSTSGGNVGFNAVVAPGAIVKIRWNNTTRKWDLIQSRDNDIREILSNESTADSTQAVLFRITLMNSTSGALTVKAPASPVAGDWFAVSDSRGQAGTNNITIAFTVAAQNLHGSSQDHVISTNKGFAKFVYVNSTVGWVIAN